MNVNFSLSTKNPILARRIEGKLNEILDEIAAEVDAPEEQTFATLYVNNERFVGDRGGMFDPVQAGRDW